MTRSFRGWAKRAANRSSQARRGSSEQTPSFKELGRELEATAQTAYEAPSFNERNERSAKAVGRESGLLATKGVADPAARKQAIGVFIKTSRKAGGAFRRSFTSSGKKIASREGEYKQAVDAAGGIASKNLVPLVAALSGKRGPLSKSEKKALRKEIRDTLRDARVEDLVKVVEETLGTRTQMSGKEVVGVLNKTIPADDWAHGSIAKMKPRQPGEKPLTGRQLRILGAAVRLANATWKSGQVHRAAWEGNRSRIKTAGSGGDYTTYEGMQHNTYKNAVKGTRGGAEKARRTGVARTTFEVFKDLEQIKPDQL